VARRHLIKIMRKFQILVGILDLEYADKWLEPGYPRDSAWFMFSQETFRLSGDLTGGAGRRVSHVPMPRNNLEISFPARLTP
jgi:hypothetical protein